LPAVALDLFEFRPVGGLVRRQLPRRRIDAEREQLVEFAVEGRTVQGITRDQVPVEGLEVSEVEDDTMALRDGPFVDRIGPHQPEQFICGPAGLRQNVHHAPSV
jgi:hypothetical protein